VPAIAAFEWHPFTISSAPEDPDTFSVHVRGVGQWTNKLYNHFQVGLSSVVMSSLQESKAQEDGSLALEPTGKPGKAALEVHVDGPFGSPSSNIYRAEHAVLIGTGIGITPFASILQSVVCRYRQVKQQCPSCSHTWADSIATVMGNLRKVDFFWINRDQKSFEWFVKLLSELEIEQAETGGALGRCLTLPAPPRPQVPGDAHVRDLRPAADRHEVGVPADGDGPAARAGQARPGDRPEVPHQRRPAQLEQGLHQDPRAARGKGEREGIGVLKLVPV
jgi:hypothetical protein